MSNSDFSGKGAAYAQGRPGYPAALFRVLTQAGVISVNSVAADVGAGTGIFTRQLAPFVRELIAVEPNVDMRRELSQHAAEGVRVVDGTAEHTTLPPSSVDVVTAAQAFHWFDRAAFAAECRRVLRGDGRVVLVWNARVEDDPLIAANAAVNRQYCPHFRGFSDGLDFTGDTFSDFFVGGCTSYTFDNPVTCTEEQFLARNLSSSYAPLPDDASYALYCAALREVFAQFAQGGVVSMSYVTRCFVGRV